MTDPFIAKAILSLARQAGIIRLHGSVEAYEDYLHALAEEYGFPVARGDA